jgi:hypothetical protein
VLPLLVPGLFLFRRGAAAARSSSGTSSARRCGRALPWPGAAAAPPSPPSHGALSGGVERENPNGVGGLDGWPSTFPLAFESRRSNGRAKSLCCPGLDCPGDRGGAASFFERARSQGRDAGVKEDSPPRSGFDPRASASNPSACGSPGWRGRPFARPLRDAARLTHRRVQAKEKRDEGEREYRD